MTYTESIYNQKLKKKNYTFESQKLLMHNGDPGENLTSEKKKKSSAHPGCAHAKQI